MLMDKLADGLLQGKAFRAIVTTVISAVALLWVFVCIFRGEWALPTTALRIGIEYLGISGIDDNINAVEGWFSDSGRSGLFYAASFGSALALNLHSVSRRHWLSGSTSSLVGWVLLMLGAQGIGSGSAVLIVAAFTVALYVMAFLAERGGRRTRHANSVLVGNFLSAVIFPLTLVLYAISLALLAYSVDSGSERA